MAVDRIGERVGMEVVARVASGLSLEGRPGWGRGKLDSGKGRLGQGALRAGQTRVGRGGAGQRQGRRGRDGCERAVGGRESGAGQAGAGQ